MKLRIGIIGTRGIPNHHGGFEQFAEYLSQGLVENGHEVAVYNSHNHPHQAKYLNDVEIIHCYDPEYLIGSMGQFIYDFNCVMDARKRNFDILLILGYTSSSIWGRLFPRNSIIVTNMDGLEWKRTKYAPIVQKYLLYAESLAVKYSDFHIADSEVIRDYLEKKYKIKTKYISYGAELPQAEDESLLSLYGVIKGDYFLLMARMEPENNIERILEGICSPGQMRKILVIGNTANSYGKKMIAKFGHDERVVFLGGIYDSVKLHTLKRYGRLYFHGHTVGGTNPSLLEAMASGVFICAHDNPFNRAVLKENAAYFTSADDVANMAKTFLIDHQEKQAIIENIEKIRVNHSWSLIVNQYQDFLFSVVNLQNERVVLYPGYQYQ